LHKDKEILKLRAIIEEYRRLKRMPLGKAKYVDADAFINKGRYLVRLMNERKSH
jgi:hypothetical protein